MVLRPAPTAAQSFTPVNYNFTPVPAEADNVSQVAPLYSTRHDFISMAANGYGQWVAESKVGDEFVNWGLLSNTCADENTLADPPTPTEAVDGGVFPDEYATTGAHVKVAANLNGSVRYVFSVPFGSPYYPGFYIAGTNDIQFGGANPADKQIDPRFVDFSKTLSTRRLVKAGLSVYPAVSATVAQVSNDDPDWKDLFDVAMDKNFLYIVWTVPNPQPNPPSDQLYSISGVAINLITNAVTGFSGGFGFRPTVACDVRNAPTSPNCDAAYVYGWVPLHPPFVYIGQTVNHFSVVNGSPTAPVMLPMIAYQPTVNQVTSYIPSQWGLVDFSNLRLLHARMLVGSAPGGWGTTPPAKCIYVLRYAVRLTDSTVSPPQFLTDLLQYKMDYANGVGTWHPNATYCEGPKLGLTRGGWLPDANKFIYIMDRNLLGCADPYDGQKDNNLFDEFHCAYQLWYPRDDNNQLVQLDHLLPLCMMRGDHSGLIRANDPQTRTLLAQSLTGSINPLPQPELGTYVLASNQMGIHVRWHYPDVDADWGNNSPSFYTRDLRRFDEDIEENTLATHDCYVADGTAHGGVQSPSVLDGRSLVLWTNPVYPSLTGNLTSNGITYPTPSARYLQTVKLHFVGDDVWLNVGPSVNSSNPARLVTLPNFKVMFEGARQGIFVKEASLWNHLGYIEQTNNFSAFASLWHDYTAFEGSSGDMNPTATIKFLGAGDYEDPNDPHGAPLDLHKPATLNIHGGADFKLPDNVSFVAQYSDINFIYESSIFPITGTSANPSISGVAAFHGPVSLDHSRCWMAVPSSVSTKNVFSVKNNLYPPSTGTDGLTETNCLFQNAQYDPGTAALTYDDAVANVNCRKNGSFSGGDFIGVSILAHNLPPGTFTIDGGRFDDIRQGQFGIYAGKYSSGTLSSNSQINITGNYFGSGYTPSGGNIGKDAIGIEVDGFDDNSQFVQVSVDHNTFMEGTGVTGSDRTKAAIWANNCAAVVMSNTISGVGYKDGIVVTGVDNSAHSGANVFLCNNKVSNCNDGNLGGAGIRTSAWIGIGKLNQVSYCDIGHRSGDDDNGFIDFSRYYENSAEGLKMTGANDILDLSGMHDAHNNYAAFDTIDHNCSSGGFGEVNLSPPNSSVTQPLLVLGTNASSGTGTFGRNSIISSFLGSVLIYYPFSSPASPFRSIWANENYWGRGAWGSLTPITLTGTSDAVYLPNCDYLPSNPTCDPNPNTAGFNVSCGIGFNERIDDKKQHNLLSTLADSSQEQCGIYFSHGNSYLHQQLYQLAYDTLRFGIESCANQKPLGPWGYFGVIDAAADGLMHVNHDSTIWVDYREWLKSVLYLDTAWYYYCSDVRSIMASMRYVPGTGTAYNGYLAIFKYVIDSGKCPKEFFPDNDSLWIKTRRDQYALWQDTVKDSIKTPFDTTLPSIDDLSLQILRGPLAGAVAAGPSAVDHEAIGMLEPRPNPFGRTLSLHYSLRSAAALRLEVYDALGKQWFVEPIGFTSAGEYEKSIDASRWPSGTYYVRLSSLAGGVMTVKLVHQK